jgi:uncharacterized protein (TIGR03086 family)
MDATTALAITDTLITDLIAGLSADQRDLPTPCTQWTVHDLINHLCEASDKAALGLRDQPLGEAGGATDYLTDGPVAGWATAVSTLQAAATPGAVAAIHAMPFAPTPMEVPGEFLLSAVTLDRLVHAWDLATATDQSFAIDDELAGWGLMMVQQMAPVEGRTGHPFGPVVAVPDDAPLTAQLLGYTGRQP